MNRKNRTRKLTVEARKIIIRLHGEGWSGRELSEAFGVSRPRISQIINDYYGEIPDVE